jgi:chemotaxis protein methyltransferase CheR
MTTAVQAREEEVSQADLLDTLSNREFAAMAALIGEVTGIHLPIGKKIMLEARLRKRLRALNVGSLSEYCAFVLGPGRRGDEIVHLIDVVTTNKTDFFREPHHFEHLLGHAVPALMHERGAGMGGNYLMTWSAGCSSGEEPYTMAMVLDQFARHHPGFSYFILGTDVSTKILDCAKRAIYTEDQAKPVPADFRHRYLLRSKDRSRGLVRIVPGLRGRVGFRRLNFLDGDFHMREPIDIIFCRNVFIYFQRETQRTILNRFLHHLAPGGFLYLGHSESINGFDLPLRQVAPTVYRKIASRGETG